MAAIIGTGKQRAGTGSRVQVQGYNLNFAKFDVDYKGEDQDTVNFESQGYDEGVYGVISAALAFGGDWNAGFNSYDNPPGLYIRDDLPNVFLYPNVLDGSFWDFPYARVRSAKNSSDVKGKVTFDCSAMSQGTFSTPTGSA